MIPYSVADLLTLWHEQGEDFALIFLDVRANVIAANPAVVRILGYEPGELIGSTLRHIFTEEDLAQGLDTHELEVATQLGRAEDDRWHVGKNGRRVWISGVMLPLRNGDGQHIGFAKLLRDRTDLRSEMATLENLVAVAKAAAQRKDDFLATLGHELRNPLGTLTNAFGLLQQRASAADEPVFSAVERQLAVFRRLLDDLRDVTRLDTGSLHLDLRPVNLQAAIAAAVGFHTSAAQSRSQRLLAVVPDPEIIVLADSVRLEQILRNLLDNAIKYTPEGGTISVTATVEGSMAVLRVEDNGIGLSTDVLPRIFDLFTRENRVIDSAADGLGIGLALVKNLVTLQGGLIQVQSAGPGLGSEFTVRLPLQLPPLAEPPMG